MNIKGAIQRSQEAFNEMFTQVDEDTTEAS